MPTHKRRPYRRGPSLSAPAEDTKQEEVQEHSFQTLDIDETLKHNLIQSGFKIMTPIQRYTIPLFTGESVAVFGLSRTGSGKTLAFLIPLLQRLISLQWQRLDGLGALILLPTAELCVQTFTVLNVLGRKYKMSVGLITGGHDVKEEQRVLMSMNIIIATPGRLLHQLSSCIQFSADNLRVLIFDEVDNLLEKGFYADIFSIIRYIPQQSEQLWLGFFTAIETPLVRKAIIKLIKYFGIAEHMLKIADINTGVVVVADLDQLVQQETDDLKEKPKGKDLCKADGVSLAQLAGISQKNITADAYGENIQFVTSSCPDTGGIKLPPNLTNIVMTVHPADKIDILFSFLKSKSNNKIVIFVATARQAAFLCESFKLCEPGIPIMCLSGRMKAGKRHSTFIEFSGMRTAALITTDMCARGVDLPIVHWVVHFDCPDGVITYAHRAGRAARMNLPGFSLLFLTEQEQGFMKRLDEAKIDYQRKTVKLRIVVSIRQKLTELCITDTYIKHLAQKAIVSYAKSIHVQGDREVFPLASELNLTDIALSYGLASNINLSVGKQHEASARPTASEQQVVSTPRSHQSEGEHTDTDDGEEKDDLLKVTKVVTSVLSSKEKEELQQEREKQIERKLLKGSIEEAARIAREAGRHKILNTSSDEESHSASDASNAKHTNNSAENEDDESGLSSYTSVSEENSDITFPNEASHISRLQQRIAQNDSFDREAHKRKNRRKSKRRVVSEQESSYDDSSFDESEEEMQSKRKQKP
ncbi:ATP-dependent RNA helicase [Giardia lamblia P15]|uniref:ATP-dependent RNA helicase n=1 Tax=Giardia intestinalis (strain P15) TaxID=658858 RepID=E1F785_GIAIA|nr:ATP-dependent RNA helicase [Giardia lamblia P15]